MGIKNNKFAVLGVGKYGATIARMLAKKGAEVYAFDLDEEKIENIKDDVAFAVTLDSTDEKALLSQGVQDVDAAVVAIGENFEAVILTSVHLMNLNVKRVIARASGDQQRLILEKVGVKEILTPEDEVALGISERLMNPSILSFLQLPDDYEIAEVKVPNGIADTSIDELDLRNKYRLTLVTIKREFEERRKGSIIKEQHTLGVPNSDTQILATDTLVVFGTEKDIERFIEINQ